LQHNSNLEEKQEADYITAGGSELDF